ncbi:hypothetical protein E4631_19295 [Hymenobacter sp. UV11]|uniref:hypothetical protein n=1 Tax=Hymenobacter sp. UV11 TaxID=1849735 RepID=UPI00105FFA7B|nr:hypothetical protein [Hymenobacter sp. UV11]TDN38044.1 hypothetical protein A8B98_00710 [Hymenobacter sp. UV11]TFZ64658.1 hypothetical protein E4631_19295 [Hymenobacter sp. UV11]
MQAAIYADTILIGHADLLLGDRSMGHIYGELLPTSAYYETVQRTVQDFCISTSLTASKWQSLRLNAQLANGYFLLPRGGYTIDDSPEFSSAPKRIDIAGIAADILSDFISSEPPRPFVEEPWEALTIEQKLALELELRQELGNVPATVQPHAHPLTNCRFSALCRFGPSDDVLFQLDCPTDSRKSFAIVHLMWSGKKESSPRFPSTTFYESFDEFKFYRMYPDKAVWED